jgi:hypothetical protein
MGQGVQINKLFDVMKGEEEGSGRRILEAAGKIGEKRGEKN